MERGWGDTAAWERGGNPGEGQGLGSVPIPNPTTHPFLLDACLLSLHFPGKGEGSSAGPKGSMILLA